MKKGRPLSLHNKPSCLCKIYVFVILLCNIMGESVTEKTVKLPTTQSSVTQYT